VAIKQWAWTPCPQTNSIRNCNRLVVACLYILSISFSLVYPNNVRWCTYICHFILDRNIHVHTPLAFFPHEFRHLVCNALG
jgi:hypothetical protein